MNSELLIGVLGLAGTISGYFFARGKSNAETKNIEEGAKTTAIDNEIKMSEYYKKMLDDIAPRYEARFKEFEETVASREKLFKEEIGLLRRENKILKSALAAKIKRIKELES